MTETSRSTASNTPPAPSVELPNYYDRLGLRRGASGQDIRRAYRDLSKLYHPDTTELESAIAIPKFQALNEAYATLSSPEKRLAYDYKIGYSRLSVMQVRHNFPEAQTHYPANAYLDPSDRPLSAGELFALFILGVTFVGCLLLVVTIGLTRGDVAASNLTPVQPTAAPTDIVLPKPTAARTDADLELPDLP